MATLGDRFLCFIIPILCIIGMILVIHNAYTISVVSYNAVSAIGGQVILGCTFPRDLRQSITVVWRKEGDSGIVYRYDKDEVLLAEQNPSFSNRTSISPEKLYLGIASLQINNVQTKDAGEYTCTVTNSEGTGVAKVTLKVKHLLNVTSANVSALVGNNVTLPCTFPPDIKQSGNISIMWQKIGDSSIMYGYENGQLVTTNLNSYINKPMSLFFNQISAGNASLKISNIQRMDEGDYKCNVSNPDWAGETVLTLSVLDPIEVVTYNVAGKPGGNVTLSCTFTPDAAQPSNVLWEKLGNAGVVYRYQNGLISLADQIPSFTGRTSLILDHLPAGDASLTISDVRMTDAGAYKCTITNSKGMGASELILTVRAVVSA